MTISVIRMQKQSVFIDDGQKILRRRSQGNYPFLELMRAESKVIVRFSIIVVGNQESMLGNIQERRSYVNEAEPCIFGGANLIEVAQKGGGLVRPP